MSVQPTWSREGIDLYLGDALTTLPELGSSVTDLTVTSPPYFNAKSYSQWATYEAYLGFLAQLFTAIRGVTKTIRLMAVNLSCVIAPRAKRSEERTRYPIPFDAVPLARQAGWEFIDDIVWEKPDGASSRAIKFSHHRRPVAYKAHAISEYILVFKNGPGLLDKVIRSHDAETIAKSLVPLPYERTSVWSLPPVSGEHPAMMPLALASRLVAYYSYMGDVVCDPCMGSSTTIEAAIRLGRKAIGIELDPKFFWDICVPRVEKALAARKETAL